MGRPLKHPEARRNNHPPQRGEWVDLEPLKEPVLPEYEEHWQMKRRFWDAWRCDPVTSQYGETDVASAVLLAEEFYDLPAAQRLRLMDSLGLTPKGKRDLRWRTLAEVATIAKQSSNVRKLRVVEDAVAGA